MNGKRRRVLSGAIKMVIILAGTFAAGGVGALASRSAPEFYGELKKPTWAPPAGVFGPVWSFLYALMAIAAFLVALRAGWKRARLPLAIFGAQLVVNAVWSWLFFAWKWGLGALIDVVVLVALVGATIAAFWRVRPLAGALLVPYLLWVAFATALTATVWRRNPRLL